MKNFDYLRLKGIGEGIDLLVSYGEKANIFAGGTDVLVKLKQRQISSEILIDSKGISDLEGIEYPHREGMKIGPLTRK